MTSTPEWVTVEEVVALNKRAVAATNEPYLLVNRDGLESAVGRQESHFNFGSLDDHDDLVLIGAKLCIGISEAQAFQQGNKRTGLAAMQMLFNLNGYELSPYAHGRLAELVLKTAHPDHSVRMDDEEFAEHIDAFVIECDDELVRGGIIADYDMANITMAMGQASNIEIRDSVVMLGAGAVAAGSIASGTISVKGVTTVDAPGLLTPEQYRKLGGLDIGKITFKPQSPEDEG
jgi:prophage maintenance system killer protein